MKSTYRDSEEIQWTSHSFAIGVKVKHLITKRKDGVDVTCMLVHIPKGREISEHIHEDQADILYPLGGYGTIWIEGMGDYILKPGSSLFIACGTRHRIHSVQEDLLLYDVFAPALI
jgi:quercetin dioxygenase-like cupin family protein